MTQRFHLGFTQAAQLLVGRRCRVRCGQHRGNLLFLQAERWFYHYRSVDSGSELLGFNLEQAIGIDLERHPDARRTGDHWWDTLEFKTGKRATIADELSFALQHMQEHRGLAVLVCSKFL